MIDKNYTIANIKDNSKYTAASALALLMSVSANAYGAEEKPVKLAEIVVKEKAEKKDEGYQAKTTTIGKFSQNAKDVPQSLTIISQDLMRDRNAYTLQDALRNVAGLTFNAGEGGRIGDNITIRGFGASSDLYLDGLRDNAQYNRETFNYERVEALKGAASMVFGRGSTGGLINQVSKEPGLDLNSEVSFGVGSHGFLRETADINQNMSDTSAVRINVMKTDSKSNRDYVETDSFGIAPSVKFGIGTDNEYLLSYYHLQYENVPDFGIPIPNVQNAKPIAVPNDTYYSLAAKSYQKDSADIFTAKQTHKFDKNNQLETTLRRSMVSRDIRVNTQSFNTTTGAITRGRQARGADENSTILQSNFTSKFNALNMDHLALVGAEYLDEDASRWSYVGTPSDPATTALNPDPYTVANNYGATYQRINPLHFNDKNFGIYGQDIIEFVKNWKLLLGVRYDDFNAQYHSTTTSTGAVTTYQRTDRVFSYRSGLMYQPNNYSNYYLAYGTAFNPSGDLYSVEATQAQRAGKTDPEKSINTELGAKWNLLNDKLSVRTAIFRTEKTNERNTDVTITDAYLLSGRRHTDGVEFEASGKVTKNWEMFGNITFMKSRIDKHVNADMIGLTPPNTPTVSGNLWNTYKLNQNWKIGGGADFVGERTGYSMTSSAGRPNIRRVPGYTRFDAMIEWNNKQYSARLNIFNLLDKEYFNSIYPNGGWGVPGLDRSAQLTFSYKF